MCVYVLPVEREGVSTLTERESHRWPARNGDKRENGLEMDSNQLCFAYFFKFAQSSN